MRNIRIKAYGKINLSLDVLGTRADGYHEVLMVMQQINLYDECLVRWFPNESSQEPERGQKEISDENEVRIEVSTNKPYIPTDDRNIAYKAAQLMAEKYGRGLSGTVRIDIKKKIPTAAGLAGGSADGAAVLHGLRRLWELPLSLDELCDLGARLGADVPFCVIGQAAVNGRLGYAEERTEGARFVPATCAVASGTGTELVPCPALEAYLVLCKPALGVSTPEAYSGYDSEEAQKRFYTGHQRKPDTESLISELGILSGLRKTHQQCDSTLCYPYMENVLEAYTLYAYPEVMKLKKRMEEFNPKGKTLMSGSGPTVYTLTGRDRKLAESIADELRYLYREVHVCRTMI